MNSAEKIFYRTKRMGDYILVTSDIGCWIFMTKEEFSFFANFPEKPMPNELFKKLYDRGFIVDQSNMDRVVDTMYRRYSNSFTTPSLFIIGITEFCNLKCTYCQLNAPKKQRKASAEQPFSLDTINQVIAFIFSTNKRDSINIEFQGGEPLLAFDTIRFFVDGIKKANEKYNININLGLSTNLTLLSKDKMDYFTKENIKVMGSIDGPAYIHDAQRVFWDGRGSYSHCQKALCLVKENLYPIGLISVITKKSLSKEKEIIDENLRCGVRWLILNWTNKNGRTLDLKMWNKIGIEPNDYLKFWMAAIDYIHELNAKNGQKIQERYLTLLLQKLFTPYSPQYADWRSPCGALIGQIAFDSSGNIYTCDEARNDSSLILGNVYKDTFKTIIQKKLSREIIGASLLENDICDYCAYKPFCGICPVLNYKTSNQFHSYQGFKDRCRIFMGMFDYIFYKMLTDYPFVESFFTLEINCYLQKEN